MVEVPAAIAELLVVVVLVVGVVFTVVVVVVLIVVLELVVLVRSEFHVANSTMRDTVHVARAL